jgi:hypothetical protein
LAAECSRQAAEGLESLANWASRRNIDDVTGSVEQFARERPVAFIGGAMVAGFALARFMKSSSARRDRRTPAYGSYRRQEAYSGMGSAGTRTGAGTAAPGTARSPGGAERDAGSIGMPGVERDAGTIATPGVERDAGTIATPGVGTAGRPGGASAGTQGTPGAGTSRAGTAGTPGTGGDGRGQHGDV